MLLTCYFALFCLFLAYQVLGPEVADLVDLQVLTWGSITGYSFNRLAAQVFFVMVIFLMF
jgi:hypothetical protein